MSKKVTKAEQKQNEIRNGILAAVRAGPGPVLQSEIVQLSLRLTRAVMLLRPDPLPDGTPNYQAFSHYKQLNRAVSSVGANIMEGFGKGGVSAGVQFYRIADGSAWESLFWAELIAPELIPDIQLLCDLLKVEIENFIQGGEMIE